MDELPEHLKDWIYLGEDKGLLPEDFAVWLVDKATLLQANQENPTHNHQTLEQQVENAYHLVVPILHEGHPSERIVRCDAWVKLKSKKARVKGSMDFSLRLLEALPTPSEGQKNQSIRFLLRSHKTQLLVDTEEKISP